MADPDSAQPELHLEGDPAVAALFAVNTAPLSVSTSAGTPQRPNAARKTCQTWVPVKMRRAIEAMQTREWSSRMLQTSTSVPSARRQWVMSACQRSLGCSAQNRRQDDRGRFCGCGLRIRGGTRSASIVETAGTASTRRRPGARRWSPRRRPGRPQRQLFAEPDDLGPRPPARPECASLIWPHLEG